MSNPARLLASLLATWTIPSGQSPESARADGNLDGLPFWEAHILAMNYMTDIREALLTLKESGQPIDFYEASIPAWYRGIFAVGVPWNSQINHTRPVVAEHEFRILNALAGHIDSHKIVPVLEESFITTAIGIATDLRKLAEKEPTLSPEIRDYLIAMIDETIQTLTGKDIHGNMAVRRKILELLGCTSTIEKTLPAESRKKWSEKTQKLMAGILGAVGMTALNVAGDVATNVLTGGGS
ncbi:hypothetical protein [Arthrobacter sp. NPDC090010]|uniref:hypothetical protein n=1 Tax=Arthrobacter sp. NPDC090010 TaxID=3363942 RepID=UPI0037F97560